MRRFLGRRRREEKRREKIISNENVLYNRRGGDGKYRRRFLLISMHGIAGRNRENNFVRFGNGE